MQQPPNQENPQTNVLDNIPFEVQRIIDELVKLLQTHSEPSDLAMHVDTLPSTGGRHIVRNFFRQVYKDLRTDELNSYASFSNSLSIIRDGRPMTTDKRSNYASFSASEFKILLETEYSQWVQGHPEHQAWAKEDTQAKAKERDEYARKVRAEFDALGKQIAKATTRAELVKLGRRREDLAPYIGIKHPYESHCWNCPSRISSTIHVRCKVCRWFICYRCGSCKKPVCDSIYYDETNDTFLPDYPEDLS